MALNRVLSILVIILIITTGCGSQASGGDRFLGEWIDVNNPGRFANVAKSGDLYIWEDNEGRYTAVYENGQLSINTGFGTANVFWDENRKTMVGVHGGQEYVFRRK